MVIVYQINHGLIDGFEGTLGLINNFFPVDWPVFLHPLEQKFMAGPTQGGVPSSWQHFCIRNQKAHGRRTKGWDGETPNSEFWDKEWMTFIQTWLGVWNIFYFPIYWE